MPPRTSKSLAPPKPEPSDDSDEEEDEDEDTTMEVKKVLPARSSRAKRVTSMHAEGDDEFWDQEFFNDQQDDEEYSLSSESEDKVDSDFDVESDPEVDEEVLVKRDAKAKGKGSVYKEPVKTKIAAPRPKKDSSHSAIQIENPIPGSKRKSGRSYTLAKGKELENKERERQANPKAKRVKVEFKKHTQEELLIEAIETEKANKKSLEDFLRFEEALKLKDEVKAESAGPCISTRSTIDKEGKLVTTVSFTGGGIAC